MAPAVIGAFVGPFGRLLEELLAVAPPQHCEPVEARLAALSSQPL